MNGRCRQSQEKSPGEYTRPVFICDCNVAEIVRISRIRLITAAVRTIKPPLPRQLIERRCRPFYRDLVSGGSGSTARDYNHAPDCSFSKGFALYFEFGFINLMI